MVALGIIVTFMQSMCGDCLDNASRYGDGRVSIRCSCFHNLQLKVAAEHSQSTI